MNWAVINALYVLAKASLRADQRFCVKIGCDVIYVDVASKGHSYRTNYWPRVGIDALVLRDCLLHLASDF